MPNKERGVCDPRERVRDPRERVRDPLIKISATVIL
jgi:hypothetical protein